MAMQLGRLWRTVRHLRREQIVGRLRLRFTRPRADQRPAPPRRTTLRRWTSGPVRPATMAAADRFRFLNVQRELQFPAGWSASSASRLWLYNLHYFDDLVASAASERAAWHAELIVRWVADNPPGQGVGWEPFPLAVRIANWIKWAWSGNELPPGAVESLAVQLRWLEQRLEYHLLGNHLLTNAWALVLGGLYFQGPEAARWLALGLAIYDRQLPEQILADGGHYERSPMYHAAVLEQLLDVFQALAAAGSDVANDQAVRRARLNEIISRMRRWLAAMTHPDGEISFFNDAALGVAPAPGEIEGYAQRLGLPARQALPEGIVELPQSGYVRLARGPAVAILDVGPLGPDFLPGHAHADTLSFELSLFGRRFAVNSGTSTYDEGPLREWQRSTAAHNTLELNGESSSEMWGSFRVGRRARTKVVPPGSLPGDSPEPGGALRYAALHDGYRKLLPGTQVMRIWELSEREFAWTDCLLDNAGQRRDFGNVAGRSRVYIHPQAVLSTSIPNLADRPQARVDHVEQATFRLGEQPVDVLSLSTDGTRPGEICVVSSRYYPGFGQEVDNVCLEFDPSSKARPTIRWSP